MITPTKTIFADSYQHNQHSRQIYKHIAKIQILPSRNRRKLYSTFAAKKVSGVLT
jgi:hypothetical protein